MCSQAFWN